MEGCNRYLLERDPNIGFGFNLSLRGERYFIQNLSPEGPAKKAGLFEYAWIQEFNSISITGLLPQDVESIINSDVFLLVTARELCTALFERDLNRANKPNQNISPTRKILRKTSTTSLNFNPDPSIDFDLKSRKSLTLSLETLQKLKKMATKKYLDLISQLHTVEGEQTYFKSKQIEKDIAETIQNIKMLERQIVSKADVQLSTVNIYNLGQVNKERKKKFTLERSFSDKLLISKSPSTNLFRVRRDRVMNSPSLNVISPNSNSFEMTSSLRQLRPTPMSGDSDGDDLDELPIISRHKPPPFDNAPFKSLDVLVTKPAYTSVLLEFLINSTRDPGPLLFYLTVKTYEDIVCNSKLIADAQLKAFDVFVTFIHNRSPLSLGISEEMKGTIWLIIQNTQVSYDVVVEIFSEVTRAIKPIIKEDMKAFQSKLDIGLGNIYGIERLVPNMSKDKEFEVVRDILVQQISHLFNETSESGHILKNYVRASTLATYFHDLCTRYFKRSPSSSTEGIPVLFSLKSAKLPKGKKYLSKCKHQMHFHQTLRFNIQNCSHCKDIIWNVSNQYEAYQCSLCTITVHKFPCFDNLLTDCTMANSKPKKHSFRANHQISHSPEISKTETPPDLPPIQIISLNSPPPLINEFLYKEDNSVLKRLQHTEPINPHQLNPSSKTNSKFLSLKSSKSSVLRSFSDRSSDRNTYVSALRHRNSLKFETKESYVHSPSNKSTTSSNSISNLSESDGSLVSSSTNRSQDSPASVPAPSDDGSTDAVPAFNGRHTEWWRNDEHITFNQPLIPWSQTANDSLKLDMKPYEMRRQDIIWELIYTERTHVQKLKVMLFVFKQPLLMQPHIVSKLKVENQLFPKLEEILELHISLLTSLLSRQQACAGPDICVGDILIEWFSNENANSIKYNHTEFSVHSDEATAIFNTWRKGKDLLKQDLILKAEQDECCKRLGISQLLALVWQRMTRYHIFIENIISTYKEECEELNNLRQALIHCNLTVGGIDDAINEKLNREVLNRYQEKLNDNSQLDSSKIPNGFSLQYLSDCETKLLHHGVLTWKVSKNKSIEVHALLFPDIFVLLEYDENKDKYFLKRYQSHTGKNQEEISPVIPLSDLIFRNQALNKASFFVCNLESGQNPKLYDFSTSCKSDRDKWESAINKAVGKFAKRNQKLERNEKEREEHFKHYKERTKKELANRSSSTPQPPSVIPNVRPHVISSISQPLQEISSQEEVEIICEISSPTSENFLDNIPESIIPALDEETKNYLAEKQRLASVFRERIPAYCDPSPAIINNNHNTPSPVLESKHAHDDKKVGWLRGFERMRSLSSQGHRERDEMSRPRSVSDRDYLVNSLRDDSKGTTDMSVSLQVAKKSPRSSAPLMTKHPLFKTEMCPIPTYDDCMLQNKLNMSSHLNKSESSLIDKPREERRSITNIFKGLKPRKNSKQFKESDFASLPPAPRFTRISLTPNLERKPLPLDSEDISISSDCPLPQNDFSPNHYPLNRTSDDIYRRISPDKSVSLDSLDNLPSTFKEQN
ncbi:Rho guanine nucleotide exchange factor 12 [Oopsacas minuta]|uniref:Rho guanine nucleotide exchange factor 12 n=1 Tax=Oopsacas minuta TaxID=111878 RepID=A0AAV7KHU2_9METZ|nr:Rho guanine nucleotide exchange factor 12 [Oopsacas minuta]